MHLQGLFFRDDHAQVAVRLRPAMPVPQMYAHNRLYVKRLTASLWLSSLPSGRRRPIAQTCGYSVTDSIDCPQPRET
jgi:hypothetical protein